jgi:hypothetical protein
LRAATRVRNVWARIVSLMYSDRKSENERCNIDDHEKCCRNE